MHVHSRRTAQTCVEILETIEALRDASYSEEVQCSQSYTLPRLKHFAEIASHVLALLGCILSYENNFFDVYEKDVSDGLGMMLHILRNCRDKVPNHFGVYEARRCFELQHCPHRTLSDKNIDCSCQIGETESAPALTVDIIEISGKHIPDIMSCKAFIGSFIGCARDFNEKGPTSEISSGMHEGAFREPHHINPDVFMDIMNATLSDLPFLPPRLFWVRSFGLRARVSWEDFLKAFLEDYENNHSGDDSSLCTESTEKLREALQRVMRKQIEDNRVGDMVPENSTTHSADVESVMSDHEDGLSGCGDVSSPPRQLLPTSSVSLEEQIDSDSQKFSQSELQSEAQEQKDTRAQFNTLTTNSSGLNGGNSNVNEGEFFSQPLEQQNQKAPQSLEEGNGKGGGDCDDSFQISRAGFAAFCGQLCAYAAFQAACDSETILVCSGQLLQGGDKSPVCGVVRGLLGYEVTQVACGGQHLAAITSTGKLFTWGECSFGQLGHGGTCREEKPRLVNEFLLKDIKCAKVACGHAYTGVVTARGGVYMWGAGENGRLGLGDARDRFLPTYVSSLRGVVITDIQAASMHTIFLSSDGILYSCGKCEYNGHGLRTDLFSPLPIIFGPSAGADTIITQVAVDSGGYHSIALTSGDKVYTWGHNRCGQLGFYTDNSQRGRKDSSKAVTKNFEGAFYSPTPTRVFLEVDSSGSGGGSVGGSSSALSDMSLKGQRRSEVSSVSAGWGHSAVLLRDGSLFMCGRNENGQLGTGDRSLCRVNERGHKFEPVFRRVKGAFEAGKATAVVCGAEHSLVICDNNEVFGTGKNESNQLSLACSPPRAEVFSRFLLPPSYEGEHTGRQVLQALCGVSCSVLLLGSSGGEHSEQGNGRSTEKSTSST